MFSFYRIHFKLDTYVPLQVEAGDVLLKVNGTDVNRFTTKEGKEPARRVCLVFQHPESSLKLVNVEQTDNIPVDKLTSNVTPSTI